MPDAGLVLVGAAGDPRHATKVVDAAARLLPGRFRWIDRVTHDRVRELLSNIDVHVLPSFREVASLSSLEAAAAGCAVVVARTRATEEYFGGDVQYCSPDSAPSVRRAIEAARAAPRQPDLRRRIEERFDWSQGGSVLADCYERLARR
jgi:glycosyltransferase involved in cell wall biosynthesis